MYRKQGMYKSTAEQLSAALKLNTIEPGGAIPYSSPSRSIGLVVHLFLNYGFYL